MIINNIDTKDISVVVQGPIDYNNTKICLQSIRENLPQSEIILSTWQGSNVDGLDYDILVLNEDPGTINMSKWETNNVKRQILSTVCGIKKTTKKYVLKIRADIKIKNNSFIKYFGKYRKYNVEWKFLNERIIVVSIPTRDPFKWETPFSISDWVSFGFREDILALWDIPYPTEEEINWFNIHPRDIKVLYKYNHLISKYNPEQHIITSFMKKFNKEPSSKHMFDTNKKAIIESLNVLINNFIVIQTNNFFQFLKKSNRACDRYHILTHNKWLKFYNKYMNTCVLFNPIDIEKLLNITKIYYCKKRFIEQMSLGINNKLELLKYVKMKPWDMIYKKNNIIMISIIIIYNGNDGDFKRTLESISIQTNKNFEVIINCDDLLFYKIGYIEDVCKNILETDRTKLSIIKDKIFDEHLNKVNGKYIQILNSGDILHPQTIEYETELIEKNIKEEPLIIHESILFKDTPPIFFISKNYTQILNDSYAIKNYLRSINLLQNIVFSKKVLDNIFKDNLQMYNYSEILNIIKLSKISILIIKPKYLACKINENNTTCKEYNI